MAYLTAKFGDFTFPQVQADLREIFELQYTLTYEEVTETKYRDVPVLDPVTGRPTGATTREPYDWRVLVVTLTARDFGGIVTGRLDAGQLAHYEALLESRGNRQYTGSPFAFDWLPYISCHFGPRVHPITGEEDDHLAVDIAVPEGTEIIAAHDGVVTIATSHESYGNYIAIDSGDGVVTKYAHCSRLLVGVGARVRTGDVIALVGSTGDSTGDHLHFEVIVNGQYMNPVYFAETTGTQGG
jgi:murein DD-endopeptidase MepM/ murein hydrolase activator NlpD